MLKRSRGNYTEKQIARCAQLSGTFGREMDRLFTEAGLGHFVTPNVHARSHNRYAEDIATFVAEFQKDGLLEYIPGRHHKGFKNFEHKQTIRDPQRLAHHLMRLAENMDDRRDLRDTEE